MSDKICRWFMSASSSERIELMCSLIHLCLPQELRFFGACVEDGGRKDASPILLEEEKRSNNIGDYENLNNINDDELLDKTVLKRLVAALSFLKSSNSKCADRLYMFITRIHKKLFSSLESGMLPLTTDNYLRDDIPDILLLFTLSAFHPAFIFRQRLKLSGILLDLKRVLNELKHCRNSNEDLNKVDDHKTRVPIHHSTGCSVDESNKCSTNEAPPTVESDYVINMEMKRGGKEEGETAHIEVAWSSGRVVTSSKSFDDIKLFIDKLRSIISNEWPDSNLVESLNAAFLEKCSSSKQQMDCVNKLFRAVFSFSEQILRDEEISRLFESFLVPSSSNNLASSPVSSPPSFPFTGAPPTSTSISKHSRSTVSSPQTRHDSGWSHNAYISSPKSDEQQNDILSHRVHHKNIHPNQKMLECQVNPDMSAFLPLSQLTPIPVSVLSPLFNNQLTVSDWLKNVRLHKYNKILSKYSWQELHSLTDGDLEREGMTKGARKKFFTEYSEAKKQFEEIRLQEGTTCNLEVKSSRASKKSDALPANYSQNIPSSNLKFPSHPSSLESSCSEDYLTPLGSPDIQSHVRRRGHINRETHFLEEDRDKFHPYESSSQRFSQSSHVKKDELVQPRHQLSIPTIFPHKLYLNDVCDHKVEKKPHLCNAKQAIENPQTFVPFSHQQHNFVIHPSDAVPRGPMRSVGDFQVGLQPLHDQSYLLPRALTSVPSSPQSNVVSTCDESESSSLKVSPQGSSGDAVHFSISSSSDHISPSINYPVVTSHHTMNDNSAPHDLPTHPTSLYENWNTPFEPAAFQQCNQCFPTHQLHNPLSIIPSPWNPSATVYYSLQHPLTFNPLPLNHILSSSNQYYQPTQYQHHRVAFPSLQSSLTAGPHEAYAYPSTPAVSFLSDVSSNETTQLKDESQMPPQSLVFLITPKPTIFPEHYDAESDLKKTICSNCGKFGHNSVACAEPSIDVELKTRTYQLDMSLKDPLTL